MKNETSVNEDLMNNPETLAYLQDESGLKFKAMKNYENLPQHIKKRVKALKNLQLDEIKIEEIFYRELSKLEAKFSEQYQVVFEKRREIVSGEREPTDLECDYESDDMDEMVNDVTNKAIISGEIQENENSTENNEVLVNNDIAGDVIGSVKGIPDFWLTVLQNCELIKENIQEHDIPVLKHLIDIKCTVKVGEETGFILEFYFSPNEYFTDEKLTKEYYVNVNAPSKVPFNYEGPEIVKTKGCTINWKPGKNKTVKVVKKIQKRGKKDSDKRTVTKVVKNDSFFNFFDPPTESLDTEDDISSDVENILESDFEIGQFIRERIIPRAVLYYTGEAVEEFDFDEDDDEEGSDEDSEDYQRKNRQDGSAGDQKPECKQQ